MITRAMKAKLRKRGVHPDVIRELRPEDAHLLLDAGTPIPPSAARAPEHDLRELAGHLAGQDSARLADQAMQFVAKGIVITPATIDTIKAGGEVPYAVRDAIWTALS